MQMESHQLVKAAEGEQWKGKSLCYVKEDKSKWEKERRKRENDSVGVDREPKDHRDGIKSISQLWWEGKGSGKSGEEEVEKRADEEDTVYMWSASEEARKYNLKSMLASERVRKITSRDKQHE